MINKPVLNNNTSTSASSSNNSAVFTSFHRSFTPEVERKKEARNFARQTTIKPYTEIAKPKVREPSHPNFIALNVESRGRELYGTTASRYIRYERARIPSVLFHRNKLSSGEGITIVRADFEPHYREWSDAIFSRVFELYLDNSDSPVQAVLKEIQTHPITDQILNITFMRYEGATQKLKVPLPVVYLNESECLGVRQGGTLVLVRHATKVWYKGPPQDIPPVLAIDLKNVPKGKVVRMQELDLPPHCRVVAPQQDQVLCVVQGKMEDVEEDEEDAAAKTNAKAAGAKGAAAAPPKK